MAKRFNGLASAAEPSPLRPTIPLRYRRPAAVALSPVLAKPVTM